MNPRDFLAEFVLPTVNEWRDDPINRRRALHAITELDNLAEHFMQHTKPIQKGDMTKERDALGGTNHIIAIIRDTHDTHKHGALHRKSARIKSGRRPYPVRHGVFEEGVFESDVFEEVEVLEIVLDDETKHLASDIIEAGLSYWQSEIAKLPR